MTGDRGRGEETSKRICDLAGARRRPRIPADVLLVSRVSALLLRHSGTLSLCFHGGKIAPGAREDRR